ncbi:MAG: glycerate kinase type-2 family protein [Halobacteriota archaeon]
MTDTGSPGPTTAIRDRDSLSTSPTRDLALSCLEAGIDAAHPERVIRDAVAVDDGRLQVGDATYDLYPYRRILVLGGGNAAAHVANAIESVLGDRLDGGIVVTDDPVSLESVTVLPGDHPVPSQRGVESTEQLLETARAVDENTLVVGVITGGGSALMAAPATGLSLADLRETTNALLRSGATIHEINAVRKHCSAIKGGQLADALAPATVVSLVLSDVVGNDLDVIASGPMVPDRSSFADALAVLDEYEVTVPESVRDRLEAGADGRISETPTAGDPIFDGVNTHVLADGFTALEAAAATAAEAGYEPLILSARLEGEARDLGTNHAALVDEMVATGHPVEPPAVLLSGGETTVSVTGEGHGGPNQEFALSAALSTDADAVVAAVDTDGIDGNSAAAGAILDAGAEFDEWATRALEDNDVTPYLDERSALVVTGPTGTNVNDLRVLVVPR